MRMLRKPFFPLANPPAQALFKGAPSSCLLTPPPPSSSAASQLLRCLPAPPPSTPSTYFVRRGLPTTTCTGAQAPPLGCVLWGTCLRSLGSSCSHRCQVVHVLPGDGAWRLEPAQPALQNGDDSLQRVPGIRGRPVVRQKAANFLLPSWPHRPANRLNHFRILTCLKTWALQCIVFPKLKLQAPETEWTPDYSLLGGKDVAARLTYLIVFIALFFLRKHL